MKKQIITIMSLIAVSLLVSFASAGTLSLSLGSYDSEIYTQETVNVPVTITASNITGSTDITLTPKSGLSCSTCTLSYTFTGASTEQGTVTFTLTGTQTGTYNPPFNSISAVSGSTSATPLSSGSSITVVESPTWSKSFTASDSSVDSGDLVTLTLTLTPSGTFQGVSADLTLSSGLSLVSGSDPRTIGTISGRSTYQWTVRATSTGTASVALSATNPAQSISANTESLTITVAGSSSAPAGAGGGGGGGTAAVSGNTYTITPEQFAAGTTGSLKAGERFSFRIVNETHYMKVLSFTDSSATIEVSSTPQIANVNIGAEKKFELTGDGYYDLIAKLNSINLTGNSTSWTIKSIHEAIPGNAEPAEEEKPGIVETVKDAVEETIDKIAKTSTGWLLALLIVLMVIVVVVILVLVSRKRKKVSKKGEINF